MMKQADGQKVPLADAQIDVFRTDMKGEYKTKTNKKGEFVFAGFPFVGTYTVCASHPTATPNWVDGVKAGRDIPVEIVVTPGDGKRPTLGRDQGCRRRQRYSSGGGGGGGSSSAPAAKARQTKLRAKS